MKQIATALFANSPFTEGKPNGYLSMRRHVFKNIVLVSLRTIIRVVHNKFLFVSPATFGPIQIITALGCFLSSLMTLLGKLSCFGKYL